VVKGPFPLRDVMNYQGSQGRYAKIQIIVSDDSFNVKKSNSNKVLGIFN